MKHIKTYKIFESAEDDFGKIGDILSDIKDDGFVYSIVDNRIISQKDKSLPTIQVYISIEAEQELHGGRDEDEVTLFSYSDVSAAISELVSQLSDDYTAKVLANLAGDLRPSKYYSSTPLAGRIKYKYRDDDIIREVQIDLYKK
jgi:hypothetical protein